MMKKIGKEMNNATGALKFNSSSSILDLCMAPGGFLATALNLNPNAQAVAFTLPPSDGGHTIFLPKGPNLTINLVDITMLAADIGIQSIPQTHPDATNFLPQHLNPDQKFDLALCDGQVLRPNVHHTRPEHRKRGEANRLTLTQLILALEHLKPGGAMVVLLHRVEAPETVQLLYAFDQFATVELFKPAVYHAKRSSFYMVATDVGAQSHEARIAIERWKRVWRLATFETEMGDTDYFEAVNEGCPSVEEVLERFGPKLVSLGRNIWRTQANALAKAPWMKKSLAY